MISAVALVMLVGTACIEDRFPCLYARQAPDGEAADLEVYPDCATVKGDFLVSVDSEHLAAAHYIDGLAAFWVSSHWYYVQPTGGKKRAIDYDNGPDPFSEGLFRSPRDGQIAFVNQQLEEEFETRYDWAWPFEDGLALVCQGCEVILTEGEHTEVQGGAWGTIDRSGQVVVPLEHTREEAWRLQLEARVALTPEPHEHL